MTDFLVSAPDAPTLAAIAGQVVGLTDGHGNIIPSGVGPDAAGWAWNYVPAWSVPTGQTTTDADGNIVPAMAQKSGVYGLLRWQGDVSTIPLPSGATISTDPDTGLVTITAGPVTMTSAIPDDFPVRFA